MRRMLLILGTVAGLACAAHPAPAQQIEQTRYRRLILDRRQPCPAPCPVPCAEPAPSVTDPTRPPVEQPLMPGAFAEGPRGGGAEMAQYNTNMFGDIIGGPRVTRIIRLPNGATVAAQVPVLGRGGFKIADNESPRPQDRVFFTYNFYNNVNTFTPGGQFAAFDAHREMIGFEKTFFDGNASFGMRLPFIQVAGNRGSFDDGQVGDLNMIFKWAFLNDLDTGNLMSTGLVITAPTGGNQFTFGGPELNSTLLQPYLGYIYNFDRAFLHGFSSLVVPTNDDDATLWLNDIGIGFWLRRDPDRFISGIVPTFEVHVLTPLDHRGLSSTPVGISDWVVLLGGVNFVFGNGSSLGVAVGAPITGPQPYDMQAVVSLNIRF